MTAIFARNVVSSEISETENFGLFYTIHLNRDDPGTCNSISLTSGSFVMKATRIIELRSCALRFSAMYTSEVSENNLVSADFFFLAKPLACRREVNALFAVGNVRSSLPHRTPCGSSCRWRTSIA